MTNVIEYPVKTSEWGKTLIDTLNPIIDRLERLIQDSRFKRFKKRLFVRKAYNIV